MLEIGELDIRDHSPLEATDQACFQTRDLRRWTITGQDDLSTSLVQGVEGVEELFLGRFLSLQKLHVINEKEVCLAIATTEILGGAFPDCSDHLVGELLGPDERDANVRLPLHDGMCDGLHQMRL